METVVDRSKNGQVIQVALGDTLRVELAENQTTGYKWEVDHLDSDFLDLLSSNYLLSQSTAPGAGGLRVIVFETKKTGSARLELKQRRPWQALSCSIASVDYTIHIS
ncbi:MAG: protease inhibitor I42 family protein [Terracidiphilus sp.]|jgi:inhibitor of cysteine peptidase